MERFDIISSGDLNEIRKFMKAYFINRTYPRYYQNTLDMMYSPGAKKFYAVIDDCLVVLVKRYLHKPLIYALLPPMHINGNVEREKEVLGKMNFLNFRLSEEDVELYGLDIGSLRRQEQFDEFVYDSSDYNGMEGKKYKNMRYYYNQAIRASYGELRFETFNNTNKFLLFRKAKDLYQRWIKSRGYNESYNIFSENIVLSDDVRLTICYIGNSPLYVSLVDYVGDKKGCIVVRFGTYDSGLQVQKSKYFAHVTEMRANEGVFNMASGYGGGLREAKEELLPRRLLKLYDTKQTVEVSRELYDSLTEKKKGLFL